MTLRRTLILFFTFCALTSFSQTKYIRRNISFKVKRIVHKLNKYDEVTGERLGRAAIISKQYKIFKTLESNATEAELYELTNHPNKTIRTYALKGLVDKNSSKVFDVLQKNQSDTVLITYRNGCLGSEHTVIGFMAGRVESYIEKNEIVLTADQRSLLDKIIEYNEGWHERNANKQTDEK